MTVSITQTDVYKELFSLLVEEPDEQLPIDDSLADICRVLSPTITAPRIREIAGKMDTNGKGWLSVDEFLGLVRSLCFRQSAEEVAGTGRELVKGLKDARRRRFLMFADERTGADVDQEELALHLAGGAAALSMYEELFAYGLEDTATALKPTGLDRLLQEVCPQQPPQERRELLKIAHLNRNARIDFTEFLILMRGARLPTALSDMVASIRDRLAIGVSLTTTPIEVQSISHSTGLPAGVGGGGGLAPLLQKQSVRESYRETVKREENLAAQRTALMTSVLTTPSRATEGYLHGLRGGSSPHRTRAHEIEMDLVRQRADKAERRASDAEQRAAKVSMVQHGFREHLDDVAVEYDGASQGNAFAQHRTQHDASLDRLRRLEGERQGRLSAATPIEPHPNTPRKNFFAGPDRRFSAAERTLPPPPTMGELKQRHVTIRSSLSRARENQDVGQAFQLASELDDLVSEYESRMSAGSAMQGGGGGGGGGEVGAGGVGGRRQSRTYIAESPSRLSHASDTRSTVDRLNRMQQKASRTKSPGRWRS